MARNYVFLKNFINWIFPSCTYNTTTVKFQNKKNSISKIQCLGLTVESFHSLPSLERRYEEALWATEKLNPSLQTCLYTDIVLLSKLKQIDSKPALKIDIALK